MQTELFNQEDQDTPVLGVTDLTRSIRKSFRKPILSNLGSWRDF